MLRGTLRLQRRLGGALSASLVTAPPAAVRRRAAPLCLTTAVRCCSTSAVSSSSSATSSSSTAPSPPRRRVQIAVVGSGPSGCFVASHLVKKHPELHVDVFERLPVPFGLCRYGVSPDHPDVKNVEKQFMELFQTGRVTWVGNVSIGKEIPVRALLAHYAAVVFATGADGSRRLRIPGEDLGGVIAARTFVEYYNTYPFPYGAPRFCPFDMERTKRAVVIGNGNVAMDVVRVLGGSYKYFCPTDMNCVCVKELMKNRVEEISVVARRGVEHSAFATAEFREITKYQEGRVTVAADHFDLGAAVAAMPAGKTMRAHKRMMELVHQYALTAGATDAEVAQLATDALGVPLHSAVTAAAASGGNTAAAAAAASSSAPPAVSSDAGKKDKRGPCRLRFRYSLTPIAILPNPHRKNYVGGVLFQKTRTEATSAAATAPKDEFCVVPCDLVMTSIGYRSDSVADVPFDHRAGVIANDRGRVRGMPRVYCAGWVKNGAKGVILHSVVDAQETVATILADIESGVIPTEPTAPAEAMDADPTAYSSPDSATTTTTTTTTMYGKYGLVDYFVAKKLQPVSMAGLQRILHVEHERGVDLGKKAEKIGSVRDMLDVALGGDVGRKANERIRQITPARSDAMLYLKELLDDDTDLSTFARAVARDVPHRLGDQHPLGRIAPDQL